MFHILLEPLVVKAQIGETKYVLCIWKDELQNMIMREQYEYKAFVGIAKNYSLVFSHIDIRGNILSLPIME
jgi:hypothetical protein